MRRNICRVRVRGIYSTSITEYLLEKGYEIVQPSKVVAERVGVNVNFEASDATVKNSEKDDGYS